MRQLVRDGKKSPVIRAKALELTGGLQQKNFVGEIRALHSFVRDRIRYVKDINGIETVHTPETLLSVGAGDCDDKATLLAALLESIGHKTRFWAVGFKPGHFSHVLVETLVGEKWLPLETTEPVSIGWRPRNVVSEIRRHN